jgi:hypothetical protein
MFKKSMKRSRQLLALGIFLILALLFSFPTHNARARVAAEVPLPGKWVGQWTRTLKVEDCQVDPCITGDATYTMPFLIRVGEDNAIMGGESGMDMTVVAGSAVLNVFVTCEVHAKYSITGGSVSLGSGGLPVFDMIIQLNGDAPVICDGCNSENLHTPLSSPLPPFSPPKAGREGG